MQPPSPEKLFLGLTGNNPDPYELLGLSSDEISSPQIIRDALQRQLNRIDQHPQANTPAADQLRMSLHVAAAVLRDKSLRSMLTPSYSSETAATSNEVKRAAMAEHKQGEPAAQPATSLLDSLEQALLATLLDSSTSSAKRQQKLAFLAQQFNTTPDELLSRIKQLSVKWNLVTAASLPDNNIASADTVYEQSPGGVKLMVALAILMGIIAVAASLFAVFMSHKPPTDFDSGFTLPPAAEHSQNTNPTEHNKTSTPDLNNSAHTETSNPSSDNADTAREENINNLLQDCRDLRRDIISAHENIPGDLLTKYHTTLFTIADRWPSFTDEQLESLLSVLTDIFYSSASSADITDLLVTTSFHNLYANTKNSDTPYVINHLWQASFLNGLLSSLYADPRCPDTLHNKLSDTYSGSEELAPASPQQNTRLYNFAVAAGNYLQSLLPDIASATGENNDILQSWTQWRRALSRCRDITKDDPQPDYAAAVQNVLLYASDPSESEITRSVLDRLLTTIDFAQQSTRYLVVQWLLDPRLSTDDMHMVTSWIVEQDLIPDLSSGMILPLDATVEMRSRITRRWSQYISGPDINTADSQEAENTSLPELDRVLKYEWLRQAERVLSHELAGVGTVKRLKTAVTCARLRAAAADLINGDTDSCRKRLSDLDIRFTTPQPPEPTHVRNDGTLTVQLLERGITESLKLERLNAFATHNTAIGEADARTLARIALADSSLRLRDAAQQAIRTSFSDSPQMMLAILDLTARVKPVRSPNLVRTLETISASELPDARSGNLIIKARIALAQRLLAVRPSAWSAHAIDELSQMLAEAYHASSGASGMAGSPELEALNLFNKWTEYAERISATLPGDNGPAAVRRRLAASRLLADGPLQRFAALQIATLEQITAVAVAELPAQRETILQSLSRTRAAIQKAQSTPAQIEILEFESLWMIHELIAAAPEAEDS